MYSMQPTLSNCIHPNVDLYNLHCIIIFPITSSTTLCLKCIVVLFICVRVIKIKGQVTYFCRQQYYITYIKLPFAV